MIALKDSFARQTSGVCAFATVCFLAACSADGITSDQAELANIAQFHMVPKSSPRQLVSAFDRYCARGPVGVVAADAQLRKAGYVPLPVRHKGTKAYVVDDRRPAVARSARMCMVQAKARTGQTDRFQRYMKKNFPKAVAVDPAPLGRGIDRAWNVPGNPGFLIATQRRVDLDRHIYALILFRAGAS